MTEDRSLVIAWLTKTFCPKVNETIADVGCGEWRWPEDFVKRPIVKFDCRGDLPGVIKWDILSVPDQKWVGRFDWVLLTQVLEHVFRPIEAVKNVLALSRKHLLISVPFVYPLHGEPDIYRFAPTFFKLVFNEYEGLKIVIETLGNDGDVRFPKQVVVHVIKS